MTLLSVALPVYNGAAYLRQALDGILAQDMADFEIVVSDNCSCDETPAILSEYARRDARLHASRTESVLPQAANVNRAVHLCTGDWIKLFCHDDLMHPGCLRSIHSAITQAASGSVGLVANAEEWLFANGYCHRPAACDKQPSLWHGRDFLRVLLDGRAPYGLPALTTATVRKAAWLDARGFDDRFAHFDVFLWTRLLMKWDYLYVSEVLTTNRIHGAQVAVASRKSLRSIGDHSLFYGEFLAAHGPTLGLSTVVYFKARSKAVSVAASSIAIALLKCDLRKALSLSTKLPASWLPALAVLVVRNLAREKRKLAALAKNVPLSLVYPD